MLVLDCRPATRKARRNRVHRARENPGNSANNITNVDATIRVSLEADVNGGFRTSAAPNWAYLVRHAGVVREQKRGTLGQNIWPRHRVHFHSQSLPRLPRRNESP